MNLARTSFTPCMYNLRRYHLNSQMTTLWILRLRRFNRFSVTPSEDECSKLKMIDIGLIGPVRLNLLKRSLPGSTVYKYQRERNISLIRMGNIS